MEWVFIVGVVVAGSIALVLMAKGFGFLKSVQGIGSGTYRTEDQGLLNRLPPSERRRIAKLARSETKIGDQEVNRRTAAACRAALATLDGIQRRRWWLLFIAIVIAVSRSFRLLSGEARRFVVDRPWHLRGRDDLLLRCPPEIDDAPEATTPGDSQDQRLVDLKRVTITKRSQTRSPGKAAHLELGASLFS